MIFVIVTSKALDCTRNRPELFETSTEASSPQWNCNDRALADAATSSAPPAWDEMTSSKSDASDGGDCVMSRVTCDTWTAEG